MKYCEKCGVSVRGRELYCPLCRHPLTGTGEDALYPLIPTVYSRYKRFFTRLGILSAVGGAGSIGLNLLFGPGRYWSAFAVLGIVCFWITLAYILQKQRNIPKTVTGQVAVVSSLCVLWDVFTGWHGWSVEYVLPIFCMSAMVSLAVFARIFRMPAGAYFIYLFIDIAFGAAPLILLLANVPQVKLPSQLCVLSSAALLAFLIVTEGRAMRSELLRRFHF